MQDLLTGAEFLVQRDGGIVAVIRLDKDSPDPSLRGDTAQMLDYVRASERKFQRERLGSLAAAA